jgi:hypothetical protein
MSESDGNASESERVGPILVEDAESEWLRARNRDPGASPPSPALVREHAQLEGMLGNLPTMRVDDSWHDDVLNAVRHDHQRTTRRRWTATILAAAAAVVGVILLWPAPRPPFDMWIRHPGDATLGDEATIGDHLMLRARLEADSDLRVYRDRTTLRARCPGGPFCSSPQGAPDEKLIDLTLDLPGQYDVLFVVGAGATAPDAPMDAYLAAARAANARVVSRQVVVR